MTPSAPRHGRCGLLALLLCLAAPASAAPATATPAGGLGDVEHASKLSALSSGLAGLLADGDGFGRAVANLGDLDGNGVTDLAVGAPGDDSGGARAGAVWIVFLGPSGEALDSFKIAAGQGGFQGDLEAGDAFGTSLVVLGDLDQDGTLELAVGAPGDDDGGNTIIFPDPQTGAVWVLSLRRDGRVVRTVKLSNGNGGLPGDLLNELDLFGQSLGCVSDLDGNGVDELIVGTPGDNENGISAGATWLLFLADDGSVLFRRKIPLGGQNSRAGESLVVLGDFDGNGADEFAVGGLFFNGATGKFQGYMLVVFLAPTGLDENVVETTPPPGADDGFGNGLANLGDLDGDGVVDVAIGGPAGDDGGTDRGQVWIAFLQLDGSVRDYVRISATHGDFDGPLADGDRFGSAVTCLGDLDGDGTIDLAVGAEGDDDGDTGDRTGDSAGRGADRGALWLLQLDDGRWQDLGGALEGPSGAPQLTGEGSLVANARAALRLTGASPDTEVVLVAGASRVDAPLLGGVLVPAADLVWLPDGRTDASGQLLIQQRWPAGVPPGTSTYYQVWLMDPSGPQGATASNALSATPP